MSNQKTEEIKLQLPVIEGYERTGEYRIAEKGEYFYHPTLERAEKAQGETVHYHFILRKKAPVYNEMDGYRRRYIEIKALEDLMPIVRALKNGEIIEDHEEGVINQIEDLIK